MKELIDSLPAEQRHAVETLRVFLDCYNSGEGIGLFAGVARYNYLETRCKIAAVQARDMLTFWSLLRQKLQCPIPPKKADAVIMPLWGFDQPQLVLRELASKAAECIMLARLLHDNDKSERRKLWKETQALLEQDDFDDDLDDLEGL